MLGILTALKDADICSSIEVIEIIDEDAVKLLKVKATLNDSSILYITELHTTTKQKYSYHWQDANGSLNIRWDNMPHWKDIENFPYHKHIENQVVPSYKVTIDDVVSEIKKRLL